MDVDLSEQGFEGKQCTGEAERGASGGSQVLNILEELWHQAPLMLADPGRPQTCWACKHWRKLSAWYLRKDLGTALQHLGLSCAQVCAEKCLGCCQSA